jgi:Gluconate 2-dehydrogenase subunit 3
MNQVIQAPRSTKKVSFSDTQMSTLNVLIELMVPASRDGRMPSAKSLQLYEDVSDLPTKDHALFESGLVEIEARALRQHRKPFAQLQTEDARAMVEALRREAAPFIQSFMVHTAGRYFAHDEVVLLMGLELRPAWPKGHIVTQGDWSLIDVVKQRAKIYREV